MEAVFAVLQAGQHYNMISLYTMMPNLDGHTALAAIRDLEEHNGMPLGHCAKIIMITALSDSNSILDSFCYGCDAYLVKPMNKKSLYKQLKVLGLVAPLRTCPR
ncbi:hypothetical protein DFAR_1650009 [Desulfarculales bacterium]